MIARPVYPCPEGFEQPCDPAADAAQAENADRAAPEHGGFQVQRLLIPVPAAAAHFAVVVGQFLGQVQCQRQGQLRHSIRVGMGVADRDTAVLYRSKVEGVHARPGDLNQLQRGRRLQKFFRNKRSEKYIGFSCHAAKRFLIKGRRDDQLVLSGNEGVQSVPNILQIYRQHASRQQNFAHGHGINL